MIRAHNNMKVLITGTTGWLGGELAKKLAEQGHSVVGLARRATKIEGVTWPTRSRRTATRSTYTPTRPWTRSFGGLVDFHNVKRSGLPPVATSGGTRKSPPSTTRPVA